MENGELRARFTSDVLLFIKAMALKHSVSEEQVIHAALTCLSFTESHADKHGNVHLINLSHDTHVMFNLWHK